MHAKSGVAAVTAALVAVGAVAFVTTQAPPDTVAIPAPQHSAVAQRLTGEAGPESESGSSEQQVPAKSQAPKRKLPASGNDPKRAPKVPRHSGPLIDAFDYQEDPFLPRPGESPTPPTIVPDLDVDKDGEGNQLLVVPVNGRETSPFGMRFHPVLKRWKLHTGQDYGAGCGTPIGASAAGRVTRVGWGGGYGNMIMIDHGTIGGHRVATLYAHLSTTVVEVGDQVEQGQGIARVGNTGYSTGCHLHFEVRVDGTFANPKDWLEGRMIVNPEISRETEFAPEPSPSPSTSPSSSPSPSASTSPSPSPSPAQPSSSPSATPSAPASSPGTSEPASEASQPEPSAEVTSSAPSEKASPSTDASGEPGPSAPATRSDPEPSKDPSKPGTSPSTPPSSSPSEEPSQSPSENPSQSPSETPETRGPSQPPAEPDSAEEPSEPQVPSEESLPEPSATA